MTRRFHPLQCKMNHLITAMGVALMVWLVAQQAFDFPWITVAALYGACALFLGFRIYLMERRLWRLQQHRRFLYEKRIALPERALGATDAIMFANLKTIAEGLWAHQRRLQLIAEQTLRPRND